MGSTPSQSRERRLTEQVTSSELQRQGMFLIITVQTDLESGLTQF